MSTPLLWSTVHKLTAVLTPGNDNAPTFAHRNNTMVIPIASSYFNVLNFIVFDVFLVSGVFLGTSWLNGLGNDYDLKDGGSQRLYLMTPPVIGGGLCGTRRWRGYVFSFLRFAALLLVLVSNVCIEGSEDTRIEVQERDVLVPYSHLNSTEVAVRRAAWAGFGCTTLDSDLYTVYGEVRETTQGEQICVTDPQLLDNPLKTGNYVKHAPLKTGGCEPPVRLGQGGLEGSAARVDVYAYTCEHATLRCIWIPQRVPTAPTARLVPQSCRGVARSDAGGIYLVENGNLNPQNPPPVSGVFALEVKNLDLRATDWMDTYRTALISQSILDDVVATTKTLRARKMVRVRVNRSITFVSHFWWGLLAIKLCLVLGLLGCAAWFWAKGYRPVAHDEHGLAQLIANGINEWDDEGNQTQTASGSEPSSSRSEIILNARDQPHGFVVFAEGYEEGTISNQRYHDYEAQRM